MTTNAYKQIDSNQSIEHKLLITINELTNNLLDSLNTVNIIFSIIKN